MPRLEPAVTDPLTQALLEEELEVGDQAIRTESEETSKTQVHKINLMLSEDDEEPELQYDDDDLSLNVTPSFDEDDLPPLQIPTRGTPPSSSPTSSTIPYDLVSIKEEEDEDEEGEEANLSPLVKELALQPLSMGLYFDQNFVTVATMDKSLEIVKTYLARIAFVDDEILIGKPAQKSRNCSNYFNIYELIKQQQSTSHFIYLKNFCSTLCTEEILAMFFKTVRKDILRLKSATTLGNVVICTAFTCLSRDKERLKLSGKMARIKNIRIVSSGLSTGVAFAHFSHYFTRKPTQKKVLLVIHPLKDSFTLSVVEIEPKSISNKFTYGSWNIHQCSTPTFILTHAQLYENIEPEAEEFYEEVLSAYKLAANRMKAALPLPPDKIIVLKFRKEETCLDKLLIRVFGRRLEKLSVGDGPIAGCCYYASREVDTSLPPDLRIQETNTSEMQINFGDKTVGKCPGYLMKTEFTNCGAIRVYNSGVVSVTEKIFGDNNKHVELCNYFLDLSPINGNSFVVSLQQKIDPDGVYSIRFDIPPEANQGSVTRMDNLLIKISDPLLGTRLDKLTQHYEDVGINAKSLKKEYYQLCF